MYTLIRTEWVHKLFLSTPGPVEPDPSRIPWAGQGCIPLPSSIVFCVSVVIAGYVRSRNSGDKEFKSGTHLPLAHSST